MASARAQNPVFVLSFGNLFPIALVQLAARLSMRRRGFRRVNYEE